MSTSPSTGFETFVPGRQDGFGHKSRLRERPSQCAFRRTFFVPFVAIFKWPPFLSLAPSENLTAPDLLQKWWTQLDSNQ